MSRDPAGQKRGAAKGRLLCLSRAARPAARAAVPEHQPVRRPAVRGGGRPGRRVDQDHAGSSRIAAALAYAAEHGKQVQCLLELRARFDEQSNIDYSRMLEDAGCGILYGLTKYKVHTKLCLITRRCPGGICYYTQVGTGNYNEKTAEQYTDLMLLTSDPAIGRDAAKTFDRLARGETVGETEALWLQAAADGAHRGADAPRPGGIHRHQGQLHERRGRHGAARARERGGHGGGAVRARHLLPAAGRARADGAHLGAQHHRAVSGARAYFRLWPRGGTGGVHRLGRPARAQHHAPDRGLHRRDRPQRARGGARGAQRQAWIMQPDGSYLRPDGAGEPFASQAYLHTYFAGRTVEKPAPPAPPQPRKKLPWWRRLWIWLKNN